MYRNKIVAAAVAALLISACGGDDDVAEATDDADPVAAESGSEGGDDDAADESAEAPDVAELEVGTAVVVVEGETYRFARGDSVFDVCDIDPEFGLGQAKMDVVDGPEEGGPHLQVFVGADKQVVVVAFRPDVGYVAGKGEETDPYVQQFGIVPPPVSLDAGDGVISGTTPVVNVFSGETVDASIAVRCE